MRLDLGFEHGQFAAIDVGCQGLGVELKLQATGIFVAQKALHDQPAVAAKFAPGMGAIYPVPSSALARTQLVKGGYYLASRFKAIWP